jgi:glucose-6-phosphate 1-dehydrogenase
VAEDSTTDTFMAARLWIDTDRWRGVPFLLRTGKQLARSEQRVSLIFSQPHGGPLVGQAPDVGNVLSFSLSGPGIINLRMVVKSPGPGFALTSAMTELPLAEVTDDVSLPPYVRLINDVIVGDRSLFTRPDGLAHTWDAVTAILDDRPPLHTYERGSWGPAAADELAGPDGWLLNS